MAFAYGFNIGPKLMGVDFATKHTTPQHTPGTICSDNKGRKWIYVKAGGVIGAFRFVKAAVADDPYTDVLIGTASAAATMVLGMTPQALASGDYAWIVKSGVVEDDAVLASASTTPGAPIVCDANGAGTDAAAADLGNAVGICLIDDADNTGTIVLY